MRVSDKAAIAFSKQGKVPILTDGDAVICDSWRGAEHLENRYPQASLFGGDTGKGLTRVINAWADRTLIPLRLPAPTKSAKKWQPTKLFDYLVARPATTSCRGDRDGGSAMMFATWSSTAAAGAANACQDFHWQSDFAVG